MPERHTYRVVAGDMQQGTSQRFLWHVRQSRYRQQVLQLRPYPVNYRCGDANRQQYQRYVTGSIHYHAAAVSGNLVGTSEWIGGSSGVNCCLNVYPDGEPYNNPNYWSSF